MTELENSSIWRSKVGEQRNSNKDSGLSRMSIRGHSKPNKEANRPHDRRFVTICILQSAPKEGGGP